MIGTVKNIDKKTATDFLLPRHYSGRKPSISWAYGWYISGVLVAVCTFGKPASNTLCDGICGKENSQYVYELNRLCRVDELCHPISSFVSACLRRLRAENLIIVSYSDTGMNHNGYVYQACNFIYTGCTKQRLEFHVEGGHSRHGSKESGQRQIRTAKHRYVFFATRDKRTLREWKDALKYTPCEYPKGENKNYVLGTVFKPTVVDYTYAK
jgi:hypothetical protein